MSVVFISVIYDKKYISMVILLKQVLQGETMRVIEKCAYSCAKFIQVNRGQTHEDRATLYFGFQAVFGDVLKFLVIAFLSIFLNSFISTLIITISFILIRSYAGGIHMNTEGSCMLISICLVVIPGVAINYTYKYFSTAALSILCLVIFVISFICIKIYAPIDCINRPITEQSEISRFKYNSILCLIILLFFSITCILLEQNLIATAILTGVLMEIFTIVPVGYRLLDMLNK